MMKKCMLVLLAMLLLVVCAAGETESDIPYLGCKHVVEDYGVLKSKDKPIALQFAEETTGFTSGACRTCKQVILFCTEEAAKANHIECDGTTHVFIRSSEVYKEGWYPVKDDHFSAHDYRIISRAECAYCNHYIMAYVNQKTEQHTFDYDATINFHYSEENKHIYLTPCTVCGYWDYRAEVCGQRENDMCNYEWNKVKDFFK